jgi:ribosomal protein S30
VGGVTVAPAKERSVGVEVTAGSATEAILKAREATPKYPASRRHEAEPRKTRDAWMKTVLRDVETWNNIPF